MEDFDLSELRKAIDGEHDPDLKAISAMVLMLMEYSNYVRSVDADLHKRALAFATETHGLGTVSFESDDLGNSPNV